jgi:CheY-like chemotaxis protein
VQNGVGGIVAMPPIRAPHVIEVRGHCQSTGDRAIHHAILRMASRGHNLPRGSLGETLVIDETQPQPGAVSDKGHILLVEDDKVLAEALGNVLRHAGFDVSVATNFRTALEVLESDRPMDLLLTDIVMPGSVNGIALSRMARLRRRDLKVVYLTGYNVPGVETEASGPILRKPIDDAVLVSEIERILATP